MSLGGGTRNCSEGEGARWLLRMSRGNLRMGLRERDLQHVPFL